MTETLALTWDRLVALEPALKGLALRVRAERDRVHPDQPYCANAAWYGYDADGRGIRTEMSDLVGMWRTVWTPAERCDLFTSEAYDVAYRHLYSLLPDCTHGGMCGRAINALAAIHDAA
jgi:hypothetical protein